AAMKPSSGLLLAAGAVAAVVLGEVRDGRGGSVGRAALALVALAAVALVLPAGFTVAAWVLVPPVVALAALGARRGVADADALRRLVPLAAGFLAVAGAAFAPALAALGPGGLAREIGAGVAGLYALPFPWPAGVAAAAGLAVFAVRSRGVGALALAALALAVGAGAAGAEAPLPALRLGAEQAAFALVPLALWSALAELRRGVAAAALAPSALAATAALQLYPRSEEHTSELQSRFDLVCRLLLEKKKPASSTATAGWSAGSASSAASGAAPSAPARATAASASSAALATRACASSPHPRRRGRPLP